MSSTITAAVVTVAATAYSIQQGRKARKASQASNEAQRQINRLRNQQARRQFMRQFRQQQAATVAAGIGTGIGLESSTIQGQLIGTASEARTADKEFKRMDDLGAEMTASLNAQAKANFYAGIGSSVAGISNQFTDWGKIKGIVTGGKG